MGRSAWRAVQALFVLSFLFSPTATAPVARAEDLGTISGHVYETGGTVPIENATVWAETFDGSNGGGATSDASGYYQILDLPAGDYRVRAGAEDHADEYYNEQGLNGENADPVTVTAGNDASGTDFTLDPGGTVSGTVTDASTGDPLEGIAVETRNNMWAGACTDASGNYTLTGLPLDTDIWIEAESRDEGWCTGPGSYVSEYWEEVTDEADATPVQLSTGDPDRGGIDFTLELGGTILGHVYESGGITPINNARVQIEDIGTGAGWEAWTDADGAYQSPVLPVGDYRLRASAPAYADEFYLDAGLYGEDATPVGITAGNVTSAIDFTLDPGGRISGLVTDASTGSPLEGIEVSTRGGLWTGACTDSEGEYILEGLPLDTGIVVGAESSGQPWCYNAGTYAPEFWEEVDNEGAATPITLSSGTAEAIDIDFTLEQGGTISGMVYEGDGATVIPYANVNFESIATGNGWGTQADATGAYHSPGLAAGDYRVRASAAGFADEFFDEAGANGENATPVTVTAGNDASDTDFTLDPGGSISGIVTDAGTGNPLPNIIIDVRNGMWFGTCTDSNGAYTISGLPLETDLPLSAESRGDAWCIGPGPYVPEFWQEVPNQDEATPIRLTAGVSEVNDVDFTLELGGTISGHVYESNGVTPIANANVQIENMATGSGWGGQTDGTGGYQSQAIPAGEYRVRASAPNHADEYYQEAGLNGANATLVTVTAGNASTDIDFTLDPGGTISGIATDSVSGDPLPNIVVETRNDIWAGACTDANGAYTLTGMPLDTDIVLAAVGRSDGWCISAAPYIEEFWQETPSQDTAMPIQLSGAEPEATGIDFTLEMGGTISGHVYQTDGSTPIGGADVELENLATGDRIELQTDGSGAYRTQPLPAGDYRARASAPGRADEYFNEAGQNGEDADPVIVTAGSDTPDINFNLDPGGSISGTVTDASTGAPLENIEVNTGLIWNGACTDSNGQYSIDGLPLDAGIVVKTEDRDTFCVSPGAYIMEVWQEVPFESEATPVTLTTGDENVGGIDFTLDLGGRITGYVFENNGSTPIANAWLVIRNIATNEYWEVETDTSGAYQSPALPAGDYRVRAGAPDFADEFYENAGLNGDAATPVHVTAGNDTSGIDFTLDPGGGIAGVVTDADTGLPLEYAAVTLTNGWWVGACTDENGAYTLPGLLLDVDIVVKATTVYEDWCWGPGHYMTHYWQDTYNEADATPIRLTVGGPKASGIDFALAPAFIYYLPITFRNGP
jgi:hypothetical protein